MCTHAETVCGSGSESDWLQGALGNLVAKPMCCTAGPSHRQELAPSADAP